MIKYSIGFVVQVDLSTRPEKSVGSDEIWKTAEDALIEALHSKGWAYELNEGDGAFYGKPYRTCVPWICLQQ